MLKTFGTSAAEAVGFGLWGEGLKGPTLTRRLAPGGSGPHVHRKYILEVQAEHRAQSECLHQHRKEQGQVFCTSDREFMCGVEMDDLWDGVKGRAVLSQHVLPVFALSQLHVHEALVAPRRVGGWMGGEVGGVERQEEHTE